MGSHVPARSLGAEGRFRLVRLLGEGGMGKVYEAFDRERSASVALKTLSELTPVHLARFKNEFRSLADLRHPNLVALDELHESDGTWFFTMELIEGSHFLRWVRPGSPGRPSAAAYAQSPGLADSSQTMDTAVGPPLPSPGGDVPALTNPPGSALLDEDRLRAAMHQLALGVSTLHQAGMVHRDIKPGNVLVTPEGRVVVLDFGLVTDEYPGHRESGFVGTVAYAAPEQVAFTAVGPPADWYAVGVTLYVSLAGWLPFVGMPTDVMKRKQLEDPSRPSEQVAGVPADLEELCMDLLARDPARRPDGAEVLARLGASATTVAVPRSRGRTTLFVGRRGELAACEQAFAETAAGQARAVLVHGESGVGKSALVRAFLDRHDRAGDALVLAGRCYERESVPYKGLDQVMDGLAEHLVAVGKEEAARFLPERIASVAELFPAFSPLVGEKAAPAEANRDAFLYRAVVFATVRELIGRLAGERPLVLALDDLQWADADTLALLAELLRPPAPAVLLVATVRTSAAGSGAFSLDALRAHLGATVVEVRVDRLPPADAVELAGKLLGDDAGAEAIATGAEGHPLFIDALVRRKLAGDKSGLLRLDDAIVERAGALGEGPLRLLEVICVAGGPVQQEACAHAAGTPFGEFAPLVAHLRSAHLVKTHGVRRGDIVEPYHDRVREAIAGRLNAELKKDVHGRLARALEQSGSADAETLAVHFREAGDAKKAARYTSRAADVARDALAFDRAARLYRAALELDPDSAATPRLRWRLADALGLAGQSLAAAQVYLEAAEHARDAGEHAELNRHAAEHFLRCGRIDPAVACIDEVLKPLGWRIPRSKARAIFDFVLERRRLSRRGRDYIAQSPDTLSAEQKHRLEVLHSLYPLGMMDTLRGHTFQMRNLRLSLDTGQRERIARALTPEMVFVACQGTHMAGEIEALDAMAQKIVLELGDSYLEGVVDAAMGCAENILGRFTRSMRRCDQAEKILRDRCVGAAWELGSARIFALRSLAYMGELVEIGRRLPYALKEAGDRGDLYVASNVRLGMPMALWAMAHDQPEIARRHSREALAEWPNTGTHLLHHHAFMGDLSLDLYEGDLDGAGRRVEGWWKRLEKSMYLRVQLTRQACVSLRARVAISRGDAKAAGKDAARLHQEKSPAGGAYATLLDAGVAGLAGDQTRARHLLATGETLARQAELGLFAAAAQRQRGRLEGGSAGAELVAAADAWMARQEIARPARMAHILVPGFPE